MNPKPKLKALNPKQIQTQISPLALLKKYHIHPKKSLGQNFLVAVPTMEKIVRQLDLKPSDKVLEIGAGIGLMTRMLAERSKFVAAVEADKEMVRLMDAEWGKIPNLHIVHGDILDTNLDKLLGRRTEKWLFAGNIPYNITSPLLFHLRKYKYLFSHGILTIQKEVADRLIAGPGTKAYGILSIAMQVVGHIEKCFTISPSSFYPEPKVESAVIKITFYKMPRYDIKDLDFFTTVVRAAFSTRRKKLKNALNQSKLLNVPTNKIEAAIKHAGIPENSRAEELCIETFAELARGLK